MRTSANDPPASAGNARRSSEMERRVLVLAPLGKDAELTRDFLMDAGLNCTTCSDFQEAIDRVSEGCGALVIAEEVLDDRALTALASMLSIQPSWSEVPICIISGGRRPVQYSLRRLAGYAPNANIVVLERPFHPQTLICSVEAALRSRLRQYQVRDLLKSVSEKEERLENILGSISDAFAALDREWRFTYANPTFMQLTGPKFGAARQFLGKVIWEVFPNIFNEEIGQRFQQAMELQKTDAFEVYYEPLQGWLDVRVFPTPDFLSIYLRNITSRKQTESALTASEVRFRATFDQASTMISILDADGTIKDINRSALAACKMTDKREVGLRYWNARCWTGSPIVQDNIQRAVELAANGEASHFESAYYTSEGEERWTDLYVTPIKDEGRLVFILAEGHDVTELREARQALEEARDMAVHASRAKDDFLASLSHELRTPLNPVLLVASEGADNKQLPEEVRRDFDSIRKNVALEARLIDDLLDLTSITRGKMSLEMGIHDLHVILKDALENVRKEIDHKSIELRTQFAGAVSVWGDSVRLQQIFWNVLKNAVKFTPSGGKIFVETHPAEDNMVCVRISDNGIGMTEAEMARIFKSFAQGDHASGGGSHRFGGLGLGLAISSLLVELHAGVIRATSEGPGRGASFEICLPLTSAAPEAKTAPSAVHAKEEKPIHGATTQHRRILLVEDHEATRTTLERLLKRRGYTVVCAGSLAEARIEVAADSAFDLVVSDIGLPDGSGNDLMQELSDRYGLRGIAVTGYGMEEDIALSKRSGFACHLTKPVSVQALEAALITASIVSKR